MLWWTLRQLKSEDFQKAEQVALELGATKEVRAVEPLLEVLRGGHQRVRSAAAWALAEIGDRRAVEPLIDAFTEQPSEVYIRALTKFKDTRAIKPLIATLLREDSPLRLLAATALEEIDPNWTQSPEAKSTVPLFLEALKDKHSEVRWVALETLEKIGDSRTVDALIQLIEHDVESVGWVITELDKLEPDWTRTPKAKAVVPSLIAVLRGQGFDRPVVAITLAAIGDSQAVPPLIDALRDRDRDVRQAAARALGIISDRRAIGPLLVAPMGGYLDPWVAQQALNTLEPKYASSSEARAVIPDCLQRLTDRRASVRQYAESTLAMIDPNWATSDAAHDALPMFRQLLTHPDNDVRTASMEVLDRIDPGWRDSAASSSAAEQ
jgi:HEAT repeat protein